MHSTPYWIPPWSTTVLLGEFTRLSWVRVLATAGVCHRCMGGTSGPRYRRGVFAATPAGARYGSRLKVPPPPKKREELVAPGHSHRDRCPVATRVPRRVLRPLPGLHLHAHPPPRHVRDPQHLQRALQLRQFLMARPPPCVLFLCVVVVLCTVVLRLVVVVVCCVPWCCVLLVQLCLLLLFHVCGWCCASLAVMLVCFCAGRVVGGNRSGGDVAGQMRR